MRRLVMAVLAVGLLFPAVSHADNQPDLLSFGGGYMNFDKNQPKKRSADFRVEYRFGYELIGGDEVGVHPFLGFETTSRDLQYELGGLALDWNFLNHGIFTWSEGVGYLNSGNMTTMGGTLQFRSEAEIGYRFDNNVRLTLEVSHISDAKITRINPGAEIAGIYVHVPIWSLINGTGRDAGVSPQTAK